MLFKDYLEVRQPLSSLEENFMQQHALWVSLLKANFPNGSFLNGDDTMDMVAFKSFFNTYQLDDFLGKFVKFYIWLESNKTITRVDFDWANPHQVALSSKDKVIGSVSPAAQSLQKGSLAFMRLLSDKYFLPLKKVGVVVKMDAASAQRQRLYHSGLTKLGYKQGDKWYESIRD